MSSSQTPWCPACGAGAQGPRCSRCGLEQDGPEAELLRGLAARLGALDRELTQLSSTRQRVAQELDWRRWSAASETSRPAPFSAPLPPEPTRQRAEWNVDGVKSLLLWLGATLLALAALTFTAVTWTRLGAGGRFALLLAVTATSSGLVVGLRRRLPATAEAFAALAITLAIIDWYALRRAGVADTVSPEAWWSLGTAVTGAFAYVIGERGRSRAARSAIALLVPASAVLTVATTCGAAWSGAIALAVLAAALLVPTRSGDPGAPIRHAWLSSWGGDAVVAAILRTEAALVWVAATVLSAIAVAGAERPSQAIVPAGAVLACGLAPAVSVAVSRRRDRDGVVVLAAVAEGAVIGALVALAVTWLGGQGLLAWAALLGAAALAAGPFARGTVRRATVVAGLAAQAPGLAWAIAAALTAVFGPLAWLSHAWAGDLATDSRLVVDGPISNAHWRAGWPAVVVFGSFAAGILLASTGGRRRRPLTPRGPSAVGAAASVALAACVAPLVAGASVGVACAVCVTTALALALGASLVDRGAPLVARGLLGVAALAALPATGWVAVRANVSLTTLACSVVVFAVAAVVTRSDALRVAYAGLATAATVALAGVATVATGASPASAGFVAAVTAGCLVAMGSVARAAQPGGPAIEVAGLVGIAAGLAAAGTSTVWLAGGFTATVALLSLAAIRRERAVVYGAAAGAAALGATWAWLANAHVTVVEAYTLPAAALALAGGVAGWRIGPSRSWASLGPAIAIALGPTLVLGVAHGDEARIVAAAIASALIVLLGAWQRLQAPLALGTTCLVVIGVDTLGPAAARLPRWAVLAAAGVLLVWVGATFERRRDVARRAADTLLHFG